MFTVRDGKEGSFLRAVGGWCNSAVPMVIFKTYEEALKQADANPNGTSCQRVVVPVTVGEPVEKKRVTIDCHYEGSRTIAQIAEAIRVAWLDKGVREGILQVIV